MSIVVFLAVWTVVALLAGIVVGKMIHFGMNSEEYERDLNQHPD